MNEFRDRFSVDAARLDRLHANLAVRAAHDDILDVTYRVVDSPIGTLLLAATEAGLVRIGFEVEGLDALLATLGTAVSPRILRSGRRTDRAARQLDEYFVGRRRTFDVPVDLRLVSGFRRDVIARLPEIPYGTTVSYAELAARAGRPAAVRAAGSACSHNPVPVIVPCHRIVRSDGTIGQYLGGTDTKIKHLALEAAA